MPEETPQALRDIELAISTGQLDHHLVDVLRAVNRRLTTGPTQSKWMLRWGDEVFTEESLTMKEVRRAEAISGMSWAALHPMTNGDSAAGLMQAFLECRQNMTPALAAKTVDAMTAEDMVDAIDQYEVEAPKAESDSAGGDG